ncbi:MAG: alpha/beta fold hydrolase [Candidatus Pacebacteria bacterium]|nr:alpha/beta fold hydrolase [Candidatus Paceibacterota bacterium]
MKKFNIACTYGAWGGGPIIQPLVTGLQNLGLEQTSSISLIGHDGDPFTSSMGSLSLRDYEDDILEKLPAGEVVGVGHSMTGVCWFNLAQRFPEKIKGVVMIDPPMLGGGADIRVTKALLSKPWRYIRPLLTNGLFTPTREDAKMMLFNGEESPHLDIITRQPAAGRAILQMLLGRLPRQSKRPCAVVIAGGSRLHPSKQKIKWSQAIHCLCEEFWDESHCGILGNTYLPQVIGNLIARVAL